MLLSLQRSIRSMLKITRRVLSRIEETTFTFSTKKKIIIINVTHSRLQRLIIKRLKYCVNEQHTINTVTKYFNISTF